MSKGSRRRPGDDDAYVREYERIFGAAALRAAKRLANETRSALHGSRHLDELTRDAQEYYGVYREDDSEADAPGALPS